MEELHGVRKEYTSHELLKDSLTETPIAMLNDWLESARRVNPTEFNAMCLSTVDADGRPDARSGRHFGRVRRERVRRRLGRYRCRRRVRSADA